MIAGRGTRIWVRATLIVAALMTVTPVIVHAVLVAPHAVFMDHQHRTAQITLANPGNEPEEVQVDLQFGYAYEWNLRFLSDSPRQ